MSDDPMPAEPTHPDQPAPVPLAPYSPPVPPPDRARPGVAIAAVLILVLVFVGGLLVGRSTAFVAGGPGTPTAPAPVATDTPAASGPSGTPSGSASPGRSPVGTIGPGVTVPPDAPADIGLLWEALMLVRQHYVDRDELDPTGLTYGTIDGLLGSLGDPGHTGFLTPEQVKSAEEQLQGSITGIGVLLSEESGVPVIVSVISGTPAKRAGLRSGDRIVAVEGASAEGLGLEEIVRRVRGPAGTSVTITVIHPGTATPVDVTIVRERIVVPAVTWAMIPGTTVADVRLVQFSQGAAEQFRTALAAAGAAGATAIVLDLRSDPGGLVDEAVGAASQLLPPGSVVYQREDAARKRTAVAVRSGARVVELPMAVLIDFGTASSAEILAGAIQDAKRGRLVGVRTVGTGTVLQTYSLSDGSALRLAVERWLTPSGRRIFPDGIAPDERVEIAPGVRPLEPPDLESMSAAQVRASGDAQLLKALELLGAP
ncbi:MAG TPA: S41 family peptidase [Candidatus Limnocylindrales bacterium]|nr:S41 family peptidase [Candidatus Limnocylindrales bacterium]